MSSDEPTTPDDPDKSDARFMVGESVNTQCFTCYGNGAILRHVATASGHGAPVRMDCPQCHGNRFLPGLHPPM